MTKYQIEELRKRNEEKWINYMGGTDRDLAIKNGVKEEKEFHVTLTRKELDDGFFYDKVVIEVDKLTHYEHGTLRLELPETFGGQHETTHQPVSGIIYKSACGIPKGCRVFFHYLQIINAKLQKNHRVGLFIICEDKPYLVLDAKQIFIGIIDGKPVALHPDFCITEAIPIEYEVVNTGVVGANKDIKILYKPESVSAGGIILEAKESAVGKPYEPFKCKVVSLPSKNGMDEHRLEALQKTKYISGEVIVGAEVQEGDVVKCGKSWNIPLDNSIQKFFGDRQLFRTRISNIKEIL